MYHYRICFTPKHLDQPPTKNKEGRKHVSFTSASVYLTLQINNKYCSSWALVLNIWNQHTATPSTAQCESFVLHSSLRWVCCFLYEDRVTREACLSAACDTRKVERPVECGLWDCECETDEFIQRLRHPQPEGCSSSIRLWHHVSWDNAHTHTDTHKHTHTHPDSFRKNMTAQ